jgi:hypothetical protein
MMSDVVILKLGHERGFKYLKILKILAIFLMIFAWIFSGWPRIWQKPPIPPKIQET